MSKWYTITSIIIPMLHEVSTLDSAPDIKLFRKNGFVIIII